MAVLGTITKQPREIIDFDISYEDFLAARTDTVALVVTEVSNAALSVSYTMINGGNSVKCVISGGADSNTYKITVLVNTTGGLVLEDEINVIVQEV